MLNKGERVKIGENLYEVKVDLQRTTLCCLKCELECYKNEDFAKLKLEYGVLFCENLISQNGYFKKVED